MTNTNPTTITILRSLPGGGKSHLSARLVMESTNTVVASADLFPGLYSVDAEGIVQIDVTKMDPAHGSSLKTAIDALSAGQSVVVDNTNLSAEELIPYVALAQAFRVACEVVTINTNPETAFGRQTHGVPYAVIRNGETGEIRKTYAFGDDETGENESVVAGFVTMVERFEAFEAPFHWQFLAWLTQSTEG
jgi:predicted kinase